MNFDELYKKRREKIYDYMKKNGIKATVFQDSEERRECAVRYLTGHPTDATLLLLDYGKSYLIVWDENLAKDRAHADEIIPSEKFGRDMIKGVSEILSDEKHDFESALSLDMEISYADYAKYRENLEGWNILMEENSVHDFTRNLRAIKDEYEIECTKKACSIGDMISKEIITNLKSGIIKTEMDAALFIERFLRENGAEKTSFDTLAAGKDRSFAIHAFPGYTQNEWGTSGLSLLDFGVCYEGYASDHTITVSRNISREQEKLLDLVELAAEECLALYKNGQKISCAVKKCDEIFAKENRVMPHGLGHGIGLQIHEAPFVSRKSPEEKKFEEGNIITLEPGLYDKDLGGVRLENDVLITKNGNEVLTHSRIFRL